MKKQSGNALVAAAIVICFVTIPVGLFLGKWYSAAVEGNKVENALRTNDKQGKNILAQFTTKLAELAQVRTMAVEDQERLIKAVFGEGGRAGNKAAMQWIQEQNIQPDLTIVNKIATIIDASRNKYENFWTSQLARCQPYTEALGHPIDGFFLEFAGYPDKGIKAGGRTIEQICTPISNSHTNNVYKTGIDDGFKF